MNPQTRQKYVLLHVLLAGFFLPAAIMFSVTGGLYTFGIKGNYNTTRHDINFTTDNTTPTLEELITKAKEISLSIQKNLPSGEPTLKKIGTSWIFEWTGASYDLTIEPTSMPGQGQLLIKNTTLHRYFVQLHKAKGGVPFKIMAGLLAIAFLLLFLSGIMMAYSNPRLKTKLYLSAVLGIITFATLAFFS